MSLTLAFGQAHRTAFREPSQAVSPSQTQGAVMTDGAGSEPEVE